MWLTKQCFQIQDVSIIHSAYIRQLLHSKWWPLPESHHIELYPLCACQGILAQILGYVKIFFMSLWCTQDYIWSSTEFYFCTNVNLSTLDYHDSRYMVLRQSPVAYTCDRTLSMSVALGLYGSDSLYINYCVIEWTVSHLTYMYIQDSQPYIIDARQKLRSSTVCVTCKTKHKEKLDTIYTTWTYGLHSTIYTLHLKELQVIEQSIVFIPWIFRMISFLQKENFIYCSVSNACYLMLCNSQPLLK